MSPTKSIGNAIILEWTVSLLVLIIKSMTKLWIILINVLILIMRTKLL